MRIIMIDFHVHTFPEKIAEKALSQLADSGQVKYYLDGTLTDLQRSMKRAHIDRSVLLPVATKATQTESINRTAHEINERSDETGILSFGAIHPDNENYRDIIRSLSAEGFQGVKLHPVFQGVYFDDIRYMRIVECACEYNMIIVVHAGYDNSFPGDDFVLPRRILPVIEKLHPEKLVLAHMGGWGCWDEVEERIVGQNVYLDTSFTITPFRKKDGTIAPISPLSKEQFCRIVRNHGADKVLFGSDSPWSPQDETVDAIQKSGLTEEECHMILTENGKRLLS